MANDLTPTGPKTYGGLKPSGTLGADEFAQHDASKAWDDQGAAEALQLSLVPEVAAYGAEQARQAVLDYTSNAFGDVSAIHNELVFLLDFSNDKASYATFYKLTDMIKKAIVEATHAGDEAMLVAIGKHIEELNRTFRPPIADTARAVTRSLRPGATRDAASRPARGAVPGRTGSVQHGRTLPAST